MKVLNDDKRLQRILKKYKITQYFTDITRFLPGMRLLQFPKHTFLYSRPEHHRYVYFLTEGMLAVYANQENGAQMLVRYCDSFIFLGDMELLGYPEPSNTVETMSECLFLGIDISMFREELMEDKRFLRFLCDSLAEKINHFEHMQFRNQANSPRQRLAIHILENQRESCFKENLRHTSELLGISYRHLHRLLSEFVEEGILERDSRKYRVVGQQQLREAIRIDGKR